MSVENDKRVDELNALFQRTAEGSEVINALSLLEDFKSYNATIPKEILHSTSPNSERRFVRKATFVQLAFALENVMFNCWQKLTDEQLDAVAFYLGYTNSERFKYQPLTQPADITAALDVLEALGVDMSVQREQLRDSLAGYQPAAA